MSRMPAGSDRRAPARLLATSAAALSICALAGCGGSKPAAVVSVETQARAPVADATVSIRGHVGTVTTDSAGAAHVDGLEPGTYLVTASAPGYYTLRERVELASGTTARVRLTYHPPLGRFLWNIGPDGMYWDEATVTRAGSTATEFDWTCTRNPKTGKETGSWRRFAGPLPYAILPDVMAPEWVPGRFPASGPPAPHAGCPASS
jgi:hypothetical protein